MQAEETEAEKICLLLDMLVKRGSKAFDKFIFALVQTDQDHLAMSLDCGRARMYIQGRDKDVKAHDSVYENSEQTLNEISKRISCFCSVLYDIEAFNLVGMKSVC